MMGDVFFFEWVFAFWARLFILVRGMMVVPEVVTKISPGGLALCAKRAAEYSHQGLICTTV